MKKQKKWMREFNPGPSRYKEPDTYISTDQRNSLACTRSLRNMRKDLNGQQASHFKDITKQGVGE